MPHKLRDASHKLYWELATRLPDKHYEPSRHVANKFIS